MITTHRQHNQRLLQTAMPDLGSDDPDLAQLCEATDLLAARIHQRIDDATGAHIQPILDVLRPHLLRTIPAATLVQLATPRGAQARRLLPPGLVLDMQADRDAARPAAARQHDLAACRFETTAPVDLVPITVDFIHADDRHAGGELRVGLRAAQPGGLASAAAGPLRFFLTGALGPAAALALWLCRGCERVDVLAAGRPLAGPSRPTVRCVGAARDFRMLPADPGCDGLRALQEYLVLPEKLACVEVTGLDALRHHPGDSCELVFSSAHARLPDDHAAVTLRLGCVPVINLFAAAASPVRRTALCDEYLLRIDGHPRDSADIFAVQTVTGLRASGASKHAYASLAHNLGAADPTNRHYSVLSRRSPLGAHDTVLRVDSPVDGAPDCDGEVLAIRLRATNRDLPLKLGARARWDARASGFADLEVAQVAPLSAPAPAPTDAAMLWGLLAELGLDAGGLADAGRTRDYLRLHNERCCGDLRQRRHNAAKIDALRNLAVAPTTRPARGALLRGLLVELTLDEQAFAGPGDAFLFGEALTALLTDITPINTFVEVRAQLYPDIRELRWTTT